MVLKEVDGCRIPGCGAPVEPEAPVPLCTTHLLAAYDWVARDVGITDLLPSRCLACGSPLGVRYPAGWVCAVCEWRVGDIPNGEAVRPRVDVVYYIRFQDRVKIGTSSNPRGRLGQLKHEELLAFERGNRRVEQQRHAQFASLRFAQTEWFRWEGALKKHVAALQAGAVDPWDNYRLWVSQAASLNE